MLQYLRLLRPQQWYKNLVIFLAIFFVNELFNPNMLFMTFLGFVSLSLISSVNYILNDLADMKRDRLHPEKRKRPIPSGKIKPITAIITALVLFFISIVLATMISKYFLIAVISLFYLNQLYTFLLKKEIIADILTIAVNFVIRAVSGTFILSVNISPWLILCPFFAALLLASSKRYVELKILGKNAASHRPSLRLYSEEMVSFIMVVSATLLVISYSLYSFISGHNLLVTLPFAIYVVFRWVYITYTSAASSIEKMLISDKRLIFSAFIWIILTFIYLY